MWTDADAKPIFHPDVFRDRVYGVTGGGRGIGLATVMAALAHGARVVTIELDPQRAECARTALQDRYQEQLEIIVGGASDEKTIARAIERATDRWSRIDGWVNNAFFSRRLPVAQQDRSDLERAWEVNVLSIWLSCKQLLPVFERAGGGAIVNVSSIMSDQTMPACAAYTSSKAGVEGMTRALAVELAPRRIRVNAVAPGYIRSYEGVDTENPAAVRAYELVTQSTQPWPEPGMPADVAHAVLFLLSPAAGFITGVTLPIDGAMRYDMRDLLDDRRAAVVADLSRIRQSQGGTSGKSESV